MVALFDQPGPGEPVTSDNYQLRQAKQVAALGNVWGSWLLGSAVEDSAVYRLPEARSDFIFSVVAERLGLPGAALVLGLYAVIAVQALAIGAAVRDPVARLVAVGFACLVAVQVLIHTGVNVGLLPVTGLSLPWVSYGGSGLAANGILMGLLVQIHLSGGDSRALGEPARPSISRATARARL